MNTPIPENHSYFGDGVQVGDLVEIGRFCSISRLVTLGAKNHPLGGLSSFPFHHIWGWSEDSEFQELWERWKEKTKTVIGPDVWIGVGSTVMSGVNIGVGAVIGAHSLVTKDVEPYSVTYGVPAKHQRFRFPEELRKSLLKTRWWELPDDVIKRLPLWDPEKTCLLISQQGGNLSVHAFPDTEAT